MTIRIDEYVRESGDDPYRFWFEKLDARTAAKVTVSLLRLSEGNTGALKSLSGGLAELRIDWGPGLRIYLAQDGDTLVVLFGGGTKRGQAVDIERARGLLAEYKARKKAAGNDKPARTRKQVAA